MRVGSSISTASHFLALRFPLSAKPFPLRISRYDPYGNLVSQSGSLTNANVYRFSSKEFHEISGLYYYGYRFYSPTLQRWINRDPIGVIGGANLFAFVRNSPVVAIDTLGLRDCPSWAEYRCANPLSSDPFLEVGKIIWGALKSGAKRCFRLVAGAGKICVSANCKSVDLSTSGVTYLADDEPVLPSGKLGAPTRRSLPGPGECVDADALYVPGAAYKIRDGQMIVIQNRPSSFERNVLGWRFGPATRQG